MFQVEVFAKLALLLYLLDESEIVGTDIHLELRGLRSRGIEGGLELGVKLFQVTCSLLVERTAQVSILGEVVLRDKCHAEELVAESYPVELFLHSFLFVGRLSQVIGISVRLLIEHRSVTVLKRKTFLMLAAVVVPFHFHLFIRGGKGIGKSFRLKGEP